MHKPIKNIILFSMCAFLFASCVPKIKAPPELDVNVPQKWESEKVVEEGDISRWWKKFGDANLDSAVAEVLKKNNDLKAAAARMDQAAAVARIAGADLYPSLNQSFSASRQKRVFVGFPFGGLDNGIPSSTTNLFGVSLDVSWELDFWGRIRAMKSAATADFQASRADLIGFQISLAGQTAKAWFAAVEAKQQVRLSEETVKNYQTTNEQVMSRYKRGLRPSLDVRFSETNVATAKAILLQRKDLLQRTMRQLEILLGRYPSARLTLSENLPNISDPIPAGLPADIISRRPDLIAAEKRLAAANARLTESRQALYPRISLTGSVGTTSNEISDLLNGDFSVWNLVGNLLTPIFQGGRLRAGVKLAKAREIEALAFYVQNVLTAYYEVETALTAEKNLEEREQALRVSAEQALAARKLAEDRYARGLAGLIEVLEAQRRAFDSQSQLLSVRRLRLDNRIDLYLALGGDFITDFLIESSSKKEQEFDE